MIASSPALAERMRSCRANVLFAPNVADTGAFARALEPGPVDPVLAALPEPRIVFVGAIAAKKLDFELLPGSPRARGLVAGAGRPGRAGRPRHRRLRADARANIHLLGPRAHADLPERRCAARPSG